VTWAHVKPFVNALVSIYKMPVHKNDERPSVDLARTVQDLLKHNVTLYTFSILNPFNSYAQVMTTVWSILQAMKKITVPLPLTVRLALLCVVTKTIDKDSREVFMVPDGYTVSNLESAKSYSSRSSRLSVKRLAVLTAVCSDDSLDSKRKKDIYDKVVAESGIPMNKGIMKSLLDKYGSVL
jgi:hypothetical protein